MEFKQIIIEQLGAMSIQDRNDILHAIEFLAFEENWKKKVYQIAKEQSGLQAMIFITNTTGWDIAKSKDYFDKNILTMDKTILWGKKK